MIKKQKIKISEGQEGFSLPLTLLIGLIVTSSLMGAVYIAMNSNQRTRFDFLRFLGRTGLDSLRTQYKTLLNDTEGGNIYHYFWVADGCSKNTPSSECSKRAKPGELENPSTAFWVDGVWKQGAGRQKAPMCKPNTNQALNWLAPHRAIQQTFYQQGIKLNPGVEPGATGFVHSYTTNEIITTGTSRQQLVSLIGGDDGGVNKAGRSAMINLQIARTMNQAGFAFLSAGYNGNEREPISLSNLRVTSSKGIPTGTILLRKNIFSASECGRQVEKFRTTFGQSPISGNSQYGGLVIFPAKFPSDLGRHPQNSGSSSHKGTAMLRKGENGQTSNRLGPGGIYHYDDLYLLPGSKLEINTSKPVTLKIKGDIHIAPGAKICNVTSFNSPCGNGKASNLTIIQADTAEANSQVNERVQCDIESRPNYRHTGEAKPLTTGGRTFTIQSTGRGNESLSAFIYAPSSTIVSAGVSKSWNNQGRYQWAQDHRSQHRYAVVNKGGYLHVARRNNQSSATLYELRDENNRALKAVEVKSNNHSYTGVGELLNSNLPYWARYYKVYMPNHVIVRHNLRTGRITTHGLTFSRTTARIQYERPIQYRDRSYRRVCRWQWCRRYGYWWWYSYLYRCYRCSYQYGWATRNLINSNIYETQMSQNQSGLSRYYNIQLMSLWNNAEIANAQRRFKGAAWARNICFSREPTNSRYRRDWINSSTSHNWEFNNEFIDEMVSRYGQEYNFGLPEYRAQSETLVDPQRILSK